jgi:hypothetical protein
MAGPALSLLRTSGLERRPSPKGGAASGELRVAKGREKLIAQFFNLPPFTEDGDVHVVVETPRGTAPTFASDPKLECFALSKSL